MQDCTLSNSISLDEIDKLDRFFDLSFDMMCIAGPDGYFKRVNPAWLKALGYTEEELFASPILDFVHPDDRESTLQSRMKISEGGLTPNFQNRYRCRDGSYRWLQWNTVADESCGLKYGVAHDVTERKFAEAAIEEHLATIKAQKAALEEANAVLAALATTDGLTGLKNHRAFQVHLAEEYDRAKRYGFAFSVILLDVDNFKQFNDVHGHPQGDIVLRTVAEILQECSRSIDTVARYGGEEFVLVLPETELEGAASFAERLRITIQEYAWQHEPITASFGVSSIQFTDQTGADPVYRADRALYLSKAAGRNRVTFLSAESAAAYARTVNAHHPRPTL